ncbi:MAG: hypothetical protein QM715_14455 [Nibricoccus sp.]
MRYKTSIFLSCLSITAFCLWLNGREMTVTTRTLNRLADIGHQKKSLDEQTTIYREKLASIEKEITALNRSIALLMKIEFTEATAPVSKEEAARKESDSIAEQEKKARGYRAHLAAQYAPFYYRSGLNDAQIDRLEIMLTDHWQSLADIDAIMETQKLKESDLAVIRLRSKAEQTLNAAEKELLGEEGFKRLQDYERTLAARQFAASVAENLYFTDCPLKAEQAEQITKLLARHNEALRNNEPFDMDKTDWAKVLKGMKSILSSGQHEGFMNVYNAHAVLPQYGEEFGRKMSSLGDLFDAKPSEKE